MTNEEKRISTRIPLQEYEIIKEKAEQSKLSMNRYLIESALDKPVSNNLNTFEIGRILCKLNILADTIKEDTARDEAKEGISEIWQYLR